MKRDQQAQLISTWQALNQCYTIGYEKLEENNAAGIHRTLNGAIMLGRNLVSVSKAGSLAWDSGASATVLAIMTRLLELSDQTEGGMPSILSEVWSMIFLTTTEIKIFNSSLQFLANLSNQCSQNPNIITKIFDGLLTGTSPATLKYAYKVHCIFSYPNLTIKEITCES